MHVCIQMKLIKYVYVYQSYKSFTEYCVSKYFKTIYRMLRHSSPLAPNAMGLSMGGCQNLVSTACVKYCEL